MVDFHLTDISKVVQLVLAPAFVVAGIGTFVTILTQRLARVVDQWVKLDETHPQREVESAELGLSRDVLSRRAQMIRRAILLCTFAAIIICSLIGLLFLDAMTSTDLSMLIALVQFERYLPRCLEIEMRPLEAQRTHALQRLE